MAPDGTVAPPPGRLVLIGTGHVFAIQDTVRDAITALRPDIVFVELDRGRLRALQERRAGRLPPLRGTWVQRRLQGFQESIAKAYGAEAGGEMLAAVEGAALVGARIGLVDRPVETTLQRALSQLTWRERLRAAWMVASGAIKAPFLRTDARASVEAELARYGEDPEAMLDELGRTFPTVRRVLIDERDAIMADRIRTLLAGRALGVAVVGDGHVPGMLRHLEGIDTTVYRLDDVRGGRLPRPDPASTATCSIGFDVPANR